MLRIEIDGGLEERLRRMALAQRRTPQDCALAAVAAWVSDCEEAAELAARLGGGQGFHRVDQTDFSD